jgi:predicted GNAT family acetyltransferase
MAVREVHDNPERSRYEITVDGELAGYSEYDTVGATRTFTHTQVDKSVREKGLGAQLVQEALDDVRASGGAVVAQCPFVKRFIQEHPEYADLLVVG